MPKFIAHISSSRSKHHLVEFEVPQEQLEGTLTHEEITMKAGWWYMNRIDFESCIGPYEWSIFPKEWLDTIKTKQ